MRKAVEKHEFIHRGKSLSGVTISLGVADYPTDGDTPAALLKAADSALYQAKESGRNKVVVAGSN